MTRKQAISILEQRKCCRECVADCTCKECDDAFDIAIKELEQEQYYKDLANSYEKTINKLTKAISEQEPKNKDLIKHIEAVQKNLNNMVEGLNDDIDYYNATYHLEQIKKEVEQ